MTTTLTPMMTMRQIRKADRDAGRFWFSKATIHHFKARVESEVFEAGDNHRLWVESRRPPYELDNWRKFPRQFCVVALTIDPHDIRYLSGPGFGSSTAHYMDLWGAMSTLYEHQARLRREQAHG